MRTLFAIVVGALVACGCSGKEEIVYRPHFSPKDVANPNNPREAKSVAKPAASKAQIVEKIGDFDVSKYGVPIYPGATVKQGSNVAFRSAKGGPRQYTVALQSPDSVDEIAKWYKDQLKNPAGYVLKGLATLQGTTESDYPVKLTIAKDEQYSLISVTIEETSKK